MISVKSQKEQAAMRAGGQILAGIMQEIGENIAPGKNTWELDKLAEKLVFANGSTPAFKGYGKETGNPFPATICASINDELVHGTPDKNRILKDGDLLKVDIGMNYKGLNLDMARTFLVGNADLRSARNKKALKLIEVTGQSFWEGIKKLGPGKKLSDYSKAAQKYIESQGFSVVRNLVGHGIGKELHEDPQIPNYYNRKYKDYELKPGMTLAFEPMVNAGGYETELGSDGWVFKSKDGSLTAHYENTVLITDTGVEVLTIFKN